MAIKSSEFYKKLETLEAARQTGITNLRAKGLDVSDLASIPNVVSKIGDIPSGGSTTVLQTFGNKIIYAANLPDTYIHLIKDGQIIDKKKTPDVTGGVVDFVVTDDGEYKIGHSKQNHDIFYQFTTHNFENITDDSIATEHIFELDEDGYYHTLVSTNYAYAICKISFNIPEDGMSIIFDIAKNTYSSTNFETMFLNIDTEVDRSMQYNKDSIYVRSNAITNKRVEYTNLSKGEHFIYVKTRKAGSGGNNAEIKFKIKSIENMPTTKVELNGIGKYITKSPIELSEYSWSEIELIANNHYGQYVFELGTTKPIKFMGANCVAKLIDFENVYDIQNNPINMSFYIRYNSGSYKWDSKSNNNGVSWVGCELRKNFMEAGDIQYRWDSSVTSSTTGTYYIWDNDNKVFVEKTLPEDYAAKTKYYSPILITEDGPFLASIKENLEGVSPKLVNNATWGGFGGTVTNITTASEDFTIINTQDKLWLMSDNNLFGDKNRQNYTTTGYKFGYEGKMFELYKTYKEREYLFGGTYDYVLRNPYPSANNGVWALDNDKGCYTNSNITNGFNLLVCFSL